MLSNRTITEAITPEITSSKESKNSNDGNESNSPKNHFEDLTYFKENMEELILFFSGNLHRDIQVLKNKPNEKKDNVTLDLENRLETLYKFINEAYTSFEKNSSHEQLIKLLCDLVEKFRTQLNIDSEPFKLMKDFYWRAIADASRMMAYLTKQPGAPKNYELCKTSFFKLNDVFVNHHRDNHIIPKEIHYHWYGKALPTRYFQNIMLGHHFAPDFKIRIFTNNQKHLFDNAHAEIAGGLDNLEAMISVNTLSELMNEAKKFFTPLAILWIEKIINEESNGLLNYAALADLTRLLSLYIYGGVYLDTDVVPTAKIDLSALPKNTGLFSAESNNNILIASPQNFNVGLCIEDFINTYIRMTRTKIHYCDQEFEWFEFNNLFSRTDGSKFASQANLSILDVKRAPVKVNPESCLTRRTIGIDVGASRITYHNSRSSTLESVKDIVPSWVNKDLKGKSFTKIKFGGIFPFCDQTWLHKSQDNSLSSKELKENQRKSGIATRRLSI